MVDGATTTGAAMTRTALVLLVALALTASACEGGATYPRPEGASGESPLCTGDQDVWYASDGSVVSSRDPVADFGWPADEFCCRWLIQRGWAVDGHGADSWCDEVWCVDGSDVYMWDRTTCF